MEFDWLDFGSEKNLNHHKKSQLFKLYALNSLIRGQIYWTLRPIVQCRVFQCERKVLNHCEQ